MSAKAQTFRIGEGVIVKHAERQHFGRRGFIVRIEEYNGARRYLVSFNTATRLHGSFYYTADELKRVPVGKRA